MPTARARVYAHRGASRELRENTMPAFRRALELGADALETDVHATADGVLVASQDRRVQLGRGAYLGNAVAGGGRQQLSGRTDQRGSEDRRRGAGRRAHAAAERRRAGHARLVPELDVAARPRARLPRADQPGAERGDAPGLPARGRATGASRTEGQRGAASAVTRPALG